MARGTRKKTKRCTPTDAHTHAQLPSANGNHSKTQGPTQHTPGPQIRVKKHHFAMETTQKTPKKHPEIPQRSTPMEGEWNELIQKIAQIQPRAGWPMLPGAAKAHRRFSMGRRAPRSCHGQYGVRQPVGGCITSFLKSKKNVLFFHSFTVGNTKIFYKKRRKRPKKT